MKHLILYVSLLCFGLICSSCQNEQEEQKGTLMVSAPVLAQSHNVVLKTRTVDDDLQLDILNDASQVIRTFAPGELTTPQKIELDAGTYTVRSYTTNWEQTYSGNEKGEAKYFTKETLVIQPECLKVLKCEVPMSNSKWVLTEIEGEGTWIKSYAFHLKTKGRDCTLQSGDYAFMEVGALTLELELTNTDGEVFHLTRTYEAQPNTCYNVKFTLTPEPALNIQRK